MPEQYPDAPPRRRTEISADATACGLGYFSLALGAVQLLAPHAMARWLGHPQAAGLVRGCGLRELGTGLGILTADDPTPWLQARVAGDMIDLAALAWCAGSGNPRRTNARLAFGAVAAVAALDLRTARALREAEAGHYVAPDFSDRSGFPRPAAEMRGAAAGKRSAAPDAKPGERAPATVVAQPESGSAAARQEPSRGAAATNNSGNQS